MVKERIHDPIALAANMIGVYKRIIAFDNEGTYTVMLTPEIVKQSGAYDRSESCLSLLDGTDHPA